MGAHSHESAFLAQCGTHRTLHARWPFSQPSTTFSTTTAMASKTFPHWTADLEKLGQFQPGGATANFHQPAILPVFGNEGAPPVQLELLTLRNAPLSRPFCTVSLTSILSKTNGSQTHLPTIMKHLYAAILAMWSSVCPWGLKPHSPRPLTSPCHRPRRKRAHIERVPRRWQVRLHRLSSPIGAALVQPTPPSSPRSTTTTVAMAAT